MQSVDSLIHARWVIPVEPAGAVLEDHALAVTGGRIVSLLPSARARDELSAKAVYERSEHVLMPGLVNAHTHAGMALFRGLADDLPLREWLERHIWPAEAQWVDASFVREGTRLAVAEMLSGGTTCFNDMYFFPNEAARVCIEAGIRACVGLIVVDFPTVWAKDASEYIGKGIAVRDELKSDELIETAFAPHAPYTVSDEPLARLRVLADELDVPVHMHVHETADEVQASIAATGERPLARLKRLGLVNARLIAVHATQLLDSEIEALAKAGVHVVHCPESNLKLASGFCPVATLREAGINVALGTDGAASNNDLDMLGETRTASLLAKGVAGDAEAIPAHEAIRMATLGGATALGLEESIGTLAPGKAADVVAVDLDHVATQPVYNPASLIVYGAGRHQVSDVWVGGRQLVGGGELLHIDREELRDATTRWRGRIARRGQ